jgi:hypothetical protein
MAGPEQIAALADPVGEIADPKYRPPVFKSARCALRWAWSPSFTNRARM